ncbi:MAG TPA: tryptophan--tRNA ligase [Acidimicrobiales bacterium]|nr:tryptophan--tRNA ligase [Acidimicrobiales bacterium]
MPEHTRLTWLLECTTAMGELRRMTQFKDKSREQEAVRVGLFTYPCLMAADILLYDADAVPVGDDQRQHLELARELANRFNHRYGETFVVPEAAIPGTAARVMDLQHPERKMSKSADSPLGTVGLLDSDDELTRKVRKAVTDTDGDMRYDRDEKPGLANLLEILAAATGRTPTEVAGEYTRYGDLKNDVAEALVELLRPIRERRTALENDRAYVDDVLARGAAHAHEVAAATYARAADAMGLMPEPGH